MAKLALIIKTTCQPGKRDEVRALWDAQLRPRLEANDGQEVYFFCNDDQNENVFYLFELYNNRELFQEQSQAPWFWEYMGQVGPLLDGQPEVAMTTPVWAKGATL